MTVENADIERKGAVFLFNEETKRVRWVIRGSELYKLVLAEPAYYID